MIDDCSTQFHDACVTYDLNLDSKAFTDTLDDLAKRLASSHDLRERTGTRAPLWSDLRKMWMSAVETQMSTCQDQDDGSRAVCVGLARFTKNLVAQVPTNQAQGFENEPDIRRLLYWHTSWSEMQKPDSYTLTRILTQTLSNLVTTNEALISGLWETYMTLPEDQVIVLRLLASPDPCTVFTVLILILNCIHGSKERTIKLCTTKIGGRVCVSLLDKMVQFYDSEESSYGAQAFDIGYDIFLRIGEAGLIPDLYSRLAAEDDIITPSQTILLKLIDSYLQTSPPVQLIPSTTVTTIQNQLSPMLSTTFLALSTYAQEAIQRALVPAGSSKSATTRPTPPASPLNLARRRSDLSEDVEESTSTWFEESPNVSDTEESDGPSKSKKSTTTSKIQELSSRLDPPAELDLLLPQVCEALVLITQCIVTIVLKEEDEVDQDVRAVFNYAIAENGQGFIENLVELLRLLDLFLPRINFGKPVGVPSKTVQATPVQEDGFSYLKRDLTRLLGILGSRDRAVQDRVRECGGIPIVMNLCVADERNPYLREHAIFTLHNLLEGNEENQAVVGAIGPSGEGYQVDTPEAMHT